MSIRISQELKDALQVIQQNQNITFGHDKASLFLNLEGTTNYNTLAKEISNWWTIYNVPEEQLPANFRQLLAECASENVIWNEIDKDNREQISRIQGQLEAKQEQVNQLNQSLEEKDKVIQRLIDEGSIENFLPIIDNNPQWQFSTEWKELLEKLSDYNFHGRAYSREIKSILKFVDSSTEQLTIDDYYKLKNALVFLPTVSLASISQSELELFRNGIERFKTDNAEILQVWEEKTILLSNRLVLTGKYQEITQQIKIDQTKIIELKTQLATKTEALNQELAKSQQLQNNLTELQNQKQENETSLKQQLKDKETELQKTLTESKESTANLRKEVEELKAQLAESKSISKKELESEQKKLKETEEKLTEQIELNQQKEQSIKQLETNLANSESFLKEAQEQLKQSQRKITELETKILDHEQLKERYEVKIKETEKALTKAQNKTEKTRKVAQENIDLAKQKITDLEAQLIDLARQKISIKKQLALSQEKDQELSKDLAQTQEELNQKKEQLKKSRLEVASLETKLKNLPRPKIKPIPSKSKPINPWILGIVLAVAGGLFLLLNNKPSPENSLSEEI